MISYLDLVIAFALSTVISFLLAYLIKYIAVKLNILDVPNQRKIQKEPVPLLGGLAIAFGSFLGLFYLQPDHPFFYSYLVGATIILITGILDDIFTLKPVMKLLGQFVAILSLILAGVIIEKITLPFLGIVELSPLLSIILTFLWMIGIINAINLIDGLDGLASGTSAIALLSIFIMAIMDGQLFVACLCIVLIGSNIGFLYHNFFPASIYMGDTGSLFLGYSIGLISILGLFKKITLFSFIVPIILLAFPIFDTLFAIIRRLVNGEKIMKPDKKHIHHQLLAAGFSHRNTVLIIYGISSMFALLAIIFSSTSIEYSMIIFSIWMFLVYGLAEVVGIVGRGKQPLINFFRRLFS